MQTERTAPAERLSWTEVRDRIRHQILDGTYGPGDKLPRDEDIAEALGCARSTVQRAMQDLSDSGIVARRRKGGTQVRPDPVTRATLDIPITRLEIEARGATYGYQLIRRATETTPPGVTAGFELPAPCPMLRIEALHLADGIPHVYEDRWISPDTVPEILTEDFSGQSANEWLVRNKPYSRCDLRFYAEKASDHIAGLMRIAPGEAVLVIERTTFIGAAPITHVKAVTAPGYQMLTRI